jgi:DNA-binding GntR family transcriptional regulator
VVEAVRRRDAEAAGRAMREHLENARRKFAGDLAPGGNA